MQLKITYKYFTVLAAAIIILTIASCHKDNASTATGSLYLHLHTNVDTTEVDSLGALYPDNNGRLMSLTFAQFFLSNISVHNSTTGNWYTIPNTYVLKRVAQEEYYVGNVPTGTYDDIRFNVGLDAATDTTLPASHSHTGGDSALATTDPTVYTDWQWGNYIFMNLQGSVDVSLAHDGSQLEIFNYQLRSSPTSSNLALATLPKMSFSVLPNQSQVVHMIADYGKLLEGIDMKVSTNRISNSVDVNPNMATIITDSIPSMFRYEYDY